MLHAYAMVLQPSYTTMCRVHTLLETRSKLRDGNTQHAEVLCEAQLVLALNMES